MAGKLYYLYLSRAARANVPIGLAAGIWGLTDEAVQRKLEFLSTSYTGRQILEQLEVGDYVLAASGGPQPRVKRGGWVDAKIAEGVLWRVTSTYHIDTSQVWPPPPTRPEERYPHRFGIELVEELRDLEREQVGVAGMDALHYSANIGGLPIPMELAPAVISNPPPPQQGETEDPGFLVFGGDLDASTLTNIRREQRKLRSRLLGNSATGTCALCGRMVPVNCLRTAHIKQRSKCSELERRELANIMPACTLGCDHLFELGYIYVDAGGAIRLGSRATVSTQALAEATADLEGRACAVHDASSEPYFRWHRDEVAAT